jgi:integrase
MAIKRAKILDDEQFQKLVKFVEENELNPDKAKLIVYLSFKGGLRAKEIASLKWYNVTDAEGNISDTLELMSDITKGGKERVVPINSELKILLQNYRSKHLNSQQVIKFQNRTKSPEHALVMWLGRLFRKAGLKGCTSHSGRRTFITKMSRKVGEFNCSMEDVRIIAGHSSLAVTQRYIESSPGLRSLIDAI